jgi:hypothetical protein
MYQEAQAELGDTSASTLIVLKRGINQGIHKLRIAMNREFTTARRTFSTAASQQYYQMPEDGIRPKSITITISGTSYPLTEVASEAEWRLMNATVVTSDTPRFFYFRGSDEYGIYPIPATSTSNAGEIIYLARHHELTADDYTTGTIGVTQNSVAIVGSGTSFTTLMAGRSLQISSNGSPDNFWYKIASFTDTTHMSLENSFGGSTGTGKTFIIGEVPDLPEEVHYAPVDWALHRAYLRRRDTTQADYYKRLFDESVDMAKTGYGRKSMSSIVSAAGTQSGVGNFWKQDISINT